MGFVRCAGVSTGRASGEFGERVIELLQDKDDCYGTLKLLQQLKRCF